MLTFKLIAFVQITGRDDTSKKGHHCPGDNSCFNLSYYCDHFFLLLQAGHSCYIYFQLLGMLGGLFPRAQGWGAISLQGQQLKMEFRGQNEICPAAFYLFITFLVYLSFQAPSPKRSPLFYFHSILCKNFFQIQTFNP